MSIESYAACKIPCITLSSILGAAAAILVKYKTAKVLPALGTSFGASVVLTVILSNLCARYAEYRKRPTQDIVSLLKKQNELLNLVRHNRKMFEDSRETASRSYFHKCIAYPNESETSCSDLQDSLKILTNTVEEYSQKEARIRIDQERLQSRFRFSSDNFAR